MKTKRKDPERLPSYWIKRGFCKGMIARDRRGQGVTSGDPAATRWCVMGAYCKAGHPDGFYKSLHAIIGDDGPSIAEWNDTHTQATALGVVRQAEMDCGLGG